MTHCIQCGMSSIEIRSIQAEAVKIAFQIGNFS